MSHSYTGFSEWNDSKNLTNRIKWSKFNTGKALKCIQIQYIIEMKQNVYNTQRHQQFYDLVKHIYSVKI